MDQKVTLPRRVIANKVQVSDVGYRAEDNTTISDIEQRYFNTSIEALRQLDPVRAIRILTRTDGTFSAALNGYLQLGMSSGYKATAYTVGTHQFDSSATAAAQSIIASLDTLYDYTQGYSSKRSLAGLLETLLKEVLQTGGCMAELVLNKFRLPEELVAIPLTSIEWVSTKSGRRFPVQTPVAGDKIPLDLPTVFYEAHAQQSNSIFPRSQFESAMNMLYMYQGLLEDIFKVLRRTGHTRMVVSIVQEAVQKMAPPEVQQDQAKMTAFFETVRADIESLLNGLEPDEAIVSYDSASIDSVTSSGDKADYANILETLSGMLASSLKSMPSILGMRIGGSQSLSNTESLVFLKMVEGIRRPVETVMSRALTLAVRLAVGTDSYVKFAFNPIELRPKSELSAHESVLNQNILRKLSLGHLTDDEAAFLMGSFPRAPGAPDLSGTLFMDSAGATQPKDMTTAQDGAQQKSMASGNNGNPPANGGGNPNG